MNGRQRRQRGNQVGNGNGSVNLVVRGQQQMRQAPQPQPSAGIPNLSAIEIGQSLTYGAALDLAHVISRTEMVPTNYRGKPQDTFAAVLYGVEVGLSPMQAAWCVNVINGRPSLNGDGMLAIANSHPSFEDIKEEPTEQGCTCTVWRKGYKEPIVRRFTVEDARRAGLWGRGGPWKQYPKRMLQMRARTWALRDAFADALRGLPLDDEVQYMNDPQPEQPQQGHGFSFVKPAPMPEPPPPVITIKEDPEPQTLVFQSEPKDGDDLAEELGNEIAKAETKVELASIDFSRVESLPLNRKQELRAAYQMRMNRIEKEPQQISMPNEASMVSSDKIPAMGIA